jgi:hypothetical protein
MMNYIFTYNIFDDTTLHDYGLGWMRMVVLILPPCLLRVYSTCRELELSGKKISN